MGKGKMSANRSLVSRFDELRKLTNLANESYLEEFLRFTTYQEECRLKWLDTLRENQRLKNLYDEIKKENINLEAKLINARKLLDQEKNRKIHAEEERMKTERQLQLVRECLLGDTRNQIHNETKEKLKFLNSTTRSRLSNDFDRLSAIQELDSTGSILSDLSYSRSDDDLDAIIQKKRTYKKHRPSEIDLENPPSVKRRRSHHVETSRKDGSDRMVATTTVTMEHDGSMSARSQIESIPAAVDYLPSAPLKCGSLESVESELSIENNAEFRREEPHEVGVLPINSNRINLTTHTFNPKTVIRPEDCDVCDKRIKFGNTVLRCQNCRASCHPSCKESLPLPCIAPGSTPITKKNMGVLAEYAPHTQPMVPAIVQHCIKEIEARGLNEHGIYRVPGSDKEIRALKEKFMKSRGAPRLAGIDIHVVCGCLKDFLRSLREPLVTHSLWWQFAKAAEMNDIEERRAKIYQAVSQLPQANRETLAFIILHLLRVAETKETNKMPISNLSTVLGVTVVGYPSEYNVNETYTLTLKAKLVLEEFLMVPAEYWSRVLWGPSSIQLSTPRNPATPYSRRTPSTRSFKKLFETPNR